MPPAQIAKLQIRLPCAPHFVYVSTHYTLYGYCVHIRGGGDVYTSNR